MIIYGQWKSNFPLKSCPGPSGAACTGSRGVEQEKRRRLQLVVWLHRDLLWTACMTIWDTQAIINTHTHNYGFPRNTRWSSELSTLFCFSTNPAFQDRLGRGLLTVRAPYGPHSFSARASCAKSNSQQWAFGARRANAHFN